MKFAQFKMAFSKPQTENASSTNHQNRSKWTAKTADLIPNPCHIEIYLSIVKVLAPTFTISPSSKNPPKHDEPSQHSPLG